MNPACAPSAVIRSAARHESQCNHSRVRRSSARDSDRLGADCVRTRAGVLQRRIDTLRGGLRLRDVRPVYFISINYKPGFSPRTYDFFHWRPRLILNSRDLAVISIPLWTLIALFATPPALVLWRARLRRLRIKAGRCPRCGYDLAGNVTGVCPECGDRIETAK